MSVTNCWAKSKFAVNFKKQLVKFAKQNFYEKKNKQVNIKQKNSICLSTLQLGVKLSTTNRIKQKLNKTLI